jgi:hypothetical protein
LFKTDTFLNVIRGNRQGMLGTVMSLIEHGPPIITFESDDYEFEKSHFTSWMGLTQLRTYNNLYIQDLYYLHELLHSATMKYGTCKNLAEFHRKMSLNELLVATFTEVYIYELIPSLRAETFNFPIWWDNRDLTEKGDLSWMGASLWAEWADLGLFSSQLDPFINVASIRKNAIMHPDPYDLCDMQISVYSTQNYDWTMMWEASWREVEDHMADYHAELKEDRTKAVMNHLTKAVKNHLAWVKSKSRHCYGIPTNRNTDCVFTVYPEEAQRFYKYLKAKSTK